MEKKPVTKYEIPKYMVKLALITGATTMMMGCQMPGKEPSSAGNVMTPVEETAIAGDVMAPAEETVEWENVMQVPDEMETDALETGVACDNSNSGEKGENTMANEKKDTTVEAEGVQVEQTEVTVNCKETAAGIEDQVPMETTLQLDGDVVVSPEVE